MKHLIWFCLILFVFQTACSPRFRIGSESAPDANFSTYKTFRKDNRNLFTKRSNPILNSELTKKRIDFAIAQELKAKGYTEVEENPDLIFNFQTETRYKQDVQQTNPNPGWGYWNMWGNPFPNQTFVRNYEETTLIIDIKDARRNELIWQGWIVGELRYTENDWNKRLNEVVKKAMERFPLKN
jgi:hypothetical protein